MIRLLFYLGILVTIYSFVLAIMSGGTFIGPSGVNDTITAFLVSLMVTVLLGVSVKINKKLWNYVLIGAFWVMDLFLTYMIFLTFGWTGDEKAGIIIIILVNTFLLLITIFNKHIDMWLKNIFKLKEGKN